MSNYKIVFKVSRGSPIQRTLQASTEKEAAKIAERAARQYNERSKDKITEFSLERIEQKSRGTSSTRSGVKKRGEAKKGHLSVPSETPFILYELFS